MKFLQMLGIGLSLLVTLPCGAVPNRAETAKSDKAKHIRDNLLLPAYDKLFKKDFLLSDVARMDAENWEGAFTQIEQFVQANDSSQMAVAQRLHALGTSVLTMLQDIVQYDVIRQRDGKNYQINFGRAAKRVIDWSTAHDQELDSLKGSLTSTLERHRKATFTAKEKGDVAGLLLEAIDRIESAAEKTSQELAILKATAYRTKELKPGSAEYQKERMIIKETV